LSEKAISIPRHVAIIMDGNGRWAKSRHLPRTAGHHQGVKTARKVVELCVQKGVEVLTLFAFSSENWKRPQGEVSSLMDLFLSALQREAKDLAKNNVRLRVIGDRSSFSDKLQLAMIQAEETTAKSDGMLLQVAANYGGRWDIIQAARTMAAEIKQGRLEPSEVSEKELESRLSTAGLPEPDLFIRTGGERRISNFLLWQLAYTELYFCEHFWPDFDADELDRAFEVFSKRERRYGMISEQVAG
jgi:undecaprenyl diphosphate synthase